MSSWALAPMPETSTTHEKPYAGRSPSVATTFRAARLRRMTSSPRRTHSWSRRAAAAPTWAMRLVLSRTAAIFTCRHVLTSAGSPPRAPMRAPAIP